MRKPAAKPTTSATMEERTHSFVDRERCSINEFFIATTGTRLNVANLANITAPTHTWAHHNQSQAPLKPQDRATRGPRSVRPRSIGQLQWTISEQPHRRSRETPNKSKRMDTKLIGVVKWNRQIKHLPNEEIYYMIKFRYLLSFKCNIRSITYIISFQIKPPRL